MTQMVPSQDQFALRYLPTGFFLLLLSSNFRMSETGCAEFPSFPWMNLGACPVLRIQPVRKARWMPRPLWLTTTRSAALGCDILTWRPRTCVSAPPVPRRASEDFNATEQPSATGGRTVCPGVFKDRRKPAHCPRASWTCQPPRQRFVKDL